MLLTAALARPAVSTAVALTKQPILTAQLAPTATTGSSGAQTGNSFRQYGQLGAGPGRQLILLLRLLTLEIQPASRQTPK